MNTDNNTMQDNTWGWKLVLGYPILSGLMMAAAFPPLPLGFLACISLLPLIPVAENLRGRVAFWRGFFAGCGFLRRECLLDCVDYPPGYGGGNFVYVAFSGAVCVVVVVCHGTRWQAGLVDGALFVGGV